MMIKKTNITTIPYFSHGTFLPTSKSLGLSSTLIKLCQHYGPGEHAQCTLNLIYLYLSSHQHHYFHLQLQLQCNIKIFCQVLYTYIYQLGSFNILAYVSPIILKHFMSLGIPLDVYIVISSPKLPKAPYFCECSIDHVGPSDCQMKYCTFCT